jgi:hypothetical protein
VSNRFTALLVCALAVALLAAGCGSSDKKSGTTRPAISKAEFLRKGNAICAQGNKQVETGAQKVFGNKKKKPSDAEAKKFATTVLIPSVEGQVDSIRALGAPKGDEDKVQAILDAADQGVAESKKDPVALIQSDAAGPFAKANKLAAAYGLKTCGS